MPSEAACAICPGRSSAVMRPVLTPSTRMRFSSGSAAADSTNAACSFPNGLSAADVL